MLKSPRFPLHRSELGSSDATHPYFRPQVRSVDDCCLDDLVLLQFQNPTGNDPKNAIADHSSYVSNARSS